MVKNDFAIEKPRKIQIAIAGYDCGAVLKDQERRRKERSVREMKAKQRHAAQSNSPAAVQSPPVVTKNEVPQVVPAQVVAPTMAQSPTDEVLDEEIMSLNAAASSAVDEQAFGELMDAFGCDPSNGGA